MEAIVVFVLLAFVAWCLSAIFDAASRKGLSAVARVSLRLVVMATPTPQRQRLADELLDHLTREPPVRQIVEAAWLLCRLLAVRSGALALDRAGLYVLAAAGPSQRGFFDVADSGEHSVDESEEPTLAVGSVMQCQRVIRAISYREEDWWPAHEGRAYLEEQRRFLQTGGQIERIFIIPIEATPSEVKVSIENARAQGAVGISVTVLYERDLPPGSFDWVKDFVLYDDRLLRISVTVPPSGRDGRSAQIYTDPEEIRNGMAWFARLKAWSAELDDD